mgnify:CR=1 FL=1
MRLLNFLKFGFFIFLKYRWFFLQHTLTFHHLVIFNGFKIFVEPIFILLFLLVHNILISFPHGAVIYNVLLLLLEFFLLFQFFLIIFLNDLLLSLFILDFRLLYHIICESRRFLLMKFCLFLHRFQDIKFKSFGQHFVDLGHLENICRNVINFFFDRFVWRFIIFVLHVFFLFFIFRILLDLRLHFFIILDVI